MQTPRLVASDVDGTLLDALEGVSARTAASVARVLATDTPFVLVTGRPPRWIPAVARAAGLRGYAVCANGAVLYDIADDRVVTAHTLEPVLLNDIVRELDSVVPGCLLAAERIGERALSLDGHEFAVEDRYVHPWPGDRPMTAPRALLLGRPAVKLLVRHESMTSDELADAAVTVLRDAVAVTFSSSIGMIEISVAGVTKATGLADVADRFDVPAADVIAFGDMPNDVSMLSWAGHGVAMANAHPAVLAVADEVTGPNSEDGVAQVLDRWF